MALAPRPDDDATHWQPASSSLPGGAGGSISQPPFIAGTVKRSTLDHIKSYRRLFGHNQLGRIPSLPTQESLDMNTVSSQPGGPNQADPIVKRTIIQGMLMTDLQRLLAGIDRLERLLRRGRYTRWLVNGTLAALWHAVVLNWIPFSRRDTFRGHPLLHSNYLATMTYLLSLPLFGFPLLKYERKLSCTVAVKEGLMDLHGLVRRGAALDDCDVKCLTDSQWDVVPWSKVEGDP